MVEGYQPDLIWLDLGLRYVQEHYKREFLAYYYDKAQEWGKRSPSPTSGTISSLARASSIWGAAARHLTYHDWLTDTTVDDGRGWSYLKDTVYKSATTLSII